MRVHFNGDGTIVVKSNAHGPSIVFHREVFGRLTKMKNVFACHLLTSCYCTNLLILFTKTNLARFPFHFLSFSWCQYVLHLHHSLPVRGPGHLRSSCAYITNGSCLVRPIYSLYHTHSLFYCEIKLRYRKILQMFSLKNIRNICYSPFLARQSTSFFISLTPLPPHFGPIFTF